MLGGVDQGEVLGGVDQGGGARRGGSREGC